MDLRTQQILQLFNSHSRIRNFLIVFCYGLIIGGIFIYVFYALNQSNTIKLVSNYKKNREDYKTEKIMINPNIKLQYSDNQVYNIQAKKAFHQDESEVFFFDVFATGGLGSITAGQLKIDEDGNHLVFSGNPVLILNNQSKQYE